MTVEDYVKEQLAAKCISLKDAAYVLGYAPQSFRNKLVRHSLNIHDIFMLCIMFEQKLMITDKYDVPSYLFEREEYISKEDAIRLTEYLNKRANKQDFGEWISNLDKDKQKMLTKGFVRTKEEMLEQAAKKSSEGTHEIMSENFTHIIVICGSNSGKAAEWLSEKIKELSPEDEFISYWVCEKLFDVYVEFRTTLLDYIE